VAVWRFEALQVRAELFGGELSLARFLVTLVGAGLLAPIAEELFFRGFCTRRCGSTPRVAGRGHQLGDLCRRPL